MLLYYTVYIHCIYISSHRKARAKLPMVSRLDYVPQNTFCTLKPLFFEVPNAANENLFIGRQWLFRETCEHLGSDLPTNRGLVVVGAPGTGKTTIVLQLVEHSCFGRASDSSYQGMYYDSSSHNNLQ